MALSETRGFFALYLGNTIQCSLVIQGEHMSVLLGLLGIVAIFL